MSLSDPIADFLTRIRNAVRAKSRFVDIPHSKMKRAVADVMLKKGFLSNVLIDEKKQTMRLFLRYQKSTRSSIINDLQRVSKPSIRKYVGVSEIPRVLSGLGIAVLSTPKGVIDGEEARKANLGGEHLCNIW